MDQPLGFCGIIKLTTHIIHRNLKHFLCIALLIALPYAFLLALITPSSTFNSLQHTISLLHNVYNASHGTIPSPPDTPPTQPPPFPLLIASFVVSFCFSLLTQPLLTFSVCRAVLNKSLAFKSSLLSVPRSALNLILTTLCVYGVVLCLCAAMAILVIIMAVGLWAIGIDWTIVVLIVAVIWSVLMVGGLLYLGIAWSLANTVVILEEKRAWEAMKRSMYLVDGSKWVVFSLAFVFGVCTMFLPITASEEASAMWRWSCTVLSSTLLAIIALYSMASTVVLYLSCKSRFNESLNTIIALSAQFGPQEISAKYMDLESARFDTA